MRRARTWLAETTAGLGIEGARRTDLELVVTEVVANAVRHGGAGDAVRVSAMAESDYLRVQVTNGGPGLVPRPGAMASEPDGGFGLFIVEQLTRRWGVTRENLQTRVWFEFEY